MQSQLNDAWMQNFDSLEKSVDQLENYIKEAEGTAGIFTDEWSEATEQIMDDLNNALFTISEPRISDPELSLEKKLRWRICGLYVNYKGVCEAFYELRVNQIGLEMQKDELRRVRAEKDESLRRMAGAVAHYSVFSVYLPVIGL